MKFRAKGRKQIVTSTPVSETALDPGNIWRHCMKCMSPQWLRAWQSLCTPTNSPLLGERLTLSGLRGGLWRISMVAAGILTLASTLVAQQYYVSPNGNDNNPALQLPLLGRALRKSIISYSQRAARSPLKVGRHSRAAWFPWPCRLAVSLRAVSLDSNLRT